MIRCSFARIAGKASRGKSIWKDIYLGVSRACSCWLQVHQSRLLTSVTQIQMLCPIVAACVNYPFLEGTGPPTAADRSPYTSLIMKTPEILPKDTTRRTTRPKTPCSLHRATSPRLLAFIVQVRKPVVTKEFPARGVQRKICPVKPALLGDAVQQDLFDHQRPRKAFRVRTLMVGS